MANKRSQSEITTAGMLAKSERAAERADKRSGLARAREELTGQYLAKMTDDDWAKVLDRIVSGDIDANICRDFEITRAAIVAKRRRDPEFSAAYDEALFNGFVNIAHDTRAIARGLDGYSTGDRKRDELIVKTDMELAKKFAARILGDKIQIDQRTITVSIDRSEADSWGRTINVDDATTIEAHDRPQDDDQE